MSKINYEVWGWDTFSSHSYPCGSFDTEEEAMAVLKAHEIDCLDQDEGLRDTFAITKITDEERIERANREAELMAEKEAELSYNPDHLRKCIKSVLSKVATVCKTFDRSKEEYRESPLFKRSVKWDHEDDCFIKVGISITKFHSDDAYRVEYEFQMQGKEHFGWYQIKSQICRIPTLEGVYEWCKSEAGCNEFIAKIDQEIKKRLHDDRF